MATEYRPQSTHRYHPLDSVTQRFAELTQVEDKDVVHAPDERARRDKDRSERAVKTREEKYPT